MASPSAPSGGVVALAAAAGAALPRVKPAIMMVSRATMVSEVSSTCVRLLSRVPIRLMAGQYHQRDGGMDRGAVGAERDQVGSIIAIDETDGRDRAGLDHGSARPGEQQPHRAAIGAREEMIFAARVRMRAAQLRVAERADQRDDAAEHPDADEGRFAADIGRDQGGSLENADADHDADDHRNAVEHR